MTTIAILGDFGITKAAAVNAVKAAGYTVLHSKGESGDHGYGSRLYFAKPNGPVNQHGWPLERGEVSKVGRVWAYTIFTHEEKAA